VSDVKALIASARLPERSVALCLHPDLTAELQDLERQLEEAEAKHRAAGSLAGGDRVELAQQMEDVRARMKSHTVDFRLRALPRRRWTALVAEHPPRPDSERDKMLGLNEETFFESLVRECTAEPILDDEDWQTLLDEALSDAQWGLLTNAAWAVNARDVDVPFSRLASRTLQTSEPASSALSGLASQSNGSTAGSPRKRGTTKATG
jgi:hypothetical protein